jgi:benzoyl-CoA reductase/2-hydroxyglutaryl-CoA dehydratase subunit BcrC/BadD/HgdB
MSEEYDAPTSPQLDATDGYIHSAKEFSNAMTLDLTDEEIARAVKIIGEVRLKYGRKFIQKFNDPNSFKLDDALKALDEMEDEVKTRLASECNVLATVDTVPILEGQPPAIEIIGIMPGGNLDRYGMDHEKKEWEVKRATAKGEDYYGQHD